MEFDFPQLSQDSSDLLRPDGVLPNVSKDNIFGALGLTFDRTTGWHGPGPDGALYTNETTLEFLDQRGLLLQPGDFPQGLINLEGSIPCPSTTSVVYLDGENAFKLPAERKHPVYWQERQGNLFCSAGEIDIASGADEVLDVYRGIAAVQRQDQGLFRVVEPNPLAVDNQHLLVMRQVDTDRNLAAMLIKEESFDYEAVADQILRLKRLTEIELPEGAAEFYGSKKYSEWLYIDGTPRDFDDVKPDTERRKQLHVAASPHIHEFMRRVDWGLRYDQELTAYLEAQQGSNSIRNMWGDLKPKNISLTEDGDVVILDPIWLLFRPGYMQQVPGCEDWEGAQLCGWQIQGFPQGHAYTLTLPTVLENGEFIDELNKAYERYYGEPIEGVLERKVKMDIAYYLTVEAVLGICWPKQEANPSGWQIEWNRIVEERYPVVAEQLIREAIPGCPDDYQIS